MSFLEVNLQKTWAGWVSEYLASGIAVTCPIIVHWQTLSPFLSLSVLHVNTDVS